MKEWSDFFVASAGAAAALTGLIFVGISINIKEILAHQSLPTRASLALLLLMTILASSLSLLAPVTMTVAGIITFIVGTITWIILTVKDKNIYAQTAQPYRKLFLYNLLFDQLATLPYVVAGVLLMMGQPAGLYFLLLAYVASFGKAVSDAWVLIIEILR